MESLTLNEAAALLARECRTRCDAHDVARWVRHGQVPGEADDRGRIVVDGDGLRELLDVSSERQYGQCAPMVDIEVLEGLLRR